MVFYIFYAVAIIILVLHFTGWLKRNNLEWIVLVLAAGVLQTEAGWKFSHATHPNDHNHRDHFILCVVDARPGGTEMGYAAGLPRGEFSFGERGCLWRMHQKRHGG